MKKWIYVVKTGEELEVWAADIDGALDVVSAYLMAPADRARVRVEPEEPPRPRKYIPVVADLLQAASEQFQGAAPTYSQCHGS